MRWIRLTLGISLGVSGLIGAPAASGDLDPGPPALVEDAPGAVLSTAVDELSAQAAYAQFLMTDPHPLCGISAYRATGTPEVEPSGVKIFAHDVAAALGHCVSDDPDPEAPSYWITLVITFEYYKDRTWNKIIEERCRFPSVAGQAVAPCAKHFAYNMDAEGNSHPAIGYWHRARFELTEPYAVGPFYAGPWPSDDAGLLRLI